MIITTYDKQVQDEFIQTFISTFSYKYGSIPEVLVHDQTVLAPTEMTLTKLENIINRFIPIHLRAEHPSLVTAKRDRNLVYLRMIFCMTARDMGYTLMSIGEHLKRDHSTVVYNIKTGYDLLETSLEFQEIYLNITPTIDPNIYPNARIVEITPKARYFRQSIDTPVLSIRKFKIYRPSSVDEVRDYFVASKTLINPRGEVDPQVTDHSDGVQPSLRHAGSGY